MLWDNFSLFCGLRHSFIQIAEPNSSHKNSRISCWTLGSHNLERCRNIHQETVSGKVSTGLLGKLFPVCSTREIYLKTSGILCCQKHWPLFADFNAPQLTRRHIAGIFNFERRGTAGIALPGWLATGRPAYLRNFLRTRKDEPLVQRVTIKEVISPYHARVSFPGGRGDTVSTRDRSCCPEREKIIALKVYH